jgi:TPR repeat protein
VADPQSIDSGSTAKLRWDVKGATEVVIDPGIGKVAASDTYEVRPLHATEYVLTATGPGGNVSARVSVNLKTAPDQTATRSATLKATRRAQLCSDAEAQFNAHQLKKAQELFLQAANLGEPRCMVELGEIYMEDNGAEAAKWFRRAADAGNSSAMLNLGVMYFLGNGVLEDYGMAAYWYRQAVAAGNADAMYNLGRMYENGQGVAKDLTRAKDLYSKAASLGNAEAKAQLLRLNVKR